MMTHRRIRQGLLVLGSLLAGFGGTLMAERSALAESYIAGMAGWTLPQKLTEVEIQQAGIPGVPPGSTLSELSLSRTLMYGAKAGHYLNSARWLGFELEAYTSTPHIKQQSITVNGTPVGTLEGSHLRVITYGANVLFRYPGERLQPYMGIGPALFQARLNDGDESSLRLGLNTQMGLRYMLTKHFLLFGEYKYNLARFKFDSVSADYQAHNLVAGIGFSF